MGGIQEEVVHVYLWLANNLCGQGKVGRERERERKQNPIIGEGDVVHKNPYAALEQAVSTFMNTLAYKEQVLTKGVK